MVEARAYRIANEIRSIYGSSVRWSDIYADEAELISNLEEIHIPDRMPANLYNGYEYIHSFAKRVQAGNELSEKQMKQAKRLALEIKIAWEIRDCWEVV